MQVNKLLLLVLLVASITATPMLAQAQRPDDVRLMVVELFVAQRGRPSSGNPIPTTDDASTNPDYKLLRYHWDTTADFWINPSNKYGLLTSAVVTAITTSAETWDAGTAADVFSYQTTTTLSAGKYDGSNVVAWGTYKEGVIAVTYIWYNIITKHIVETDTLLNTGFAWSLAGEGDNDKGDTGTMDVQNIMTHEFGHWCGLADLYDNQDYWLTMYGYANYGETHKRTLGKGDILGLQAVYVA